MKPGFLYNAPLRRCIETGTAYPVIEAIAPLHEDVRKTADDWNAGTLTNVTADADGRVALTPSSATGIQQTSGTDNVTDLDDASPWQYIACEFGNSLYGDNPRIRGLDLYLDLQPNGSTPPFDGEFVVYCCRIARLAVSTLGTPTPLLGLQPVATSLRVKASEQTALAGYVSFTFPQSPYAWGTQAPVLTKDWVPRLTARPARLNAGEAYAGTGVTLNSTNRMAVFILLAVGGTNTNYALKKDAGSGNPYASGGNQLYYFTGATLNTSPGAGRFGVAVTDGVGCPRMKVYTDTYPATGTVEIDGYDLGASPSGTVEFRVVANVPPGCTGQAYVRVPTGPGPWIACSDGDTPADIGIASQQTYDMKYEMASDSTQTATPELFQLGVVDRVTADLTELATLSDYEESVTVLTGEVRMAEATLTLARTGIRDFKDLVTTLLTTYHPTALQIRVLLAGPNLTRAQYGLLDLWDVDGVEGTDESVMLTLVSLLNRLRGRFPRAAGTQTGYLWKTATISDAPAGADFTQELSLTTETADTVSATVAASSTEVQRCYTVAQVPGLIRWPTGTWVVNVEVTTGNTNIYLGVRVVRVNASGTVQERRPDRTTIATAEEQQCTAGVKSFTFNDLAWSEGASAGTDRLCLELYLRNAAGTNQTVVFGTGTANSECRPPWIQTTSVSPQVFSNVYPGSAFATWRDSVIGLPARFRGGVPDTNRHRISKAVLDADGKRELERIAFMDGCTVIASQGLIKAVNLWGPRQRPQVVIGAEGGSVAATRGFSDRLPEYRCGYGYDQQLPRDFAGEVVFQHTAAYAAFGPSRLQEADPGLENEMAQYVPTPALAGEIARAVVLAMGSGFMQASLTPNDWLPAVEIGDDVAFETDQLMLLDPSTGVGIRGYVWAVGTVIGTRGWNRSGLQVWIRGVVDLFQTTGTVQQRLPYESPLVVATVSQPPGDLRNALVIARCSSLTASIYYAVHDDATAPPSRDRPELWTAYSGPVTVTRDASAYILFSLFAREGGFTGPVATYRIAPDARASIATATGGESGTSPAITVTWSLSGVDGDTRRVRWYMRKHATSYPTLDGTTTGILDETYFVAETAVAADAGGVLTQDHTGTSYATSDKSKLIAVPLDYNGNPGERKTGDYTVAGTASRDLSGITWAQHTAGGSGVDRTYDFSWGAGTMSATDDLFLYQSMNGETPSLVTQETTDPTTTTSKSDVDSGLIPSSGKFDPWVTLTFSYVLKDSGGTVIATGDIAAAAGDTFQVASL